jgi:alpha-N-arabinofuranosidase
VNHANVVKAANMAQLVNVIAPIFTNDKGLFLQTIYYPLQLFATYSHGTALDLFVEGPTYDSKQHKGVPYLDVSAVHGADGTLVVNVTNRHREQALDAVIELEDKKFSGDFDVYEVNGPDIKSENNFETASVKTTRQKPLAASGTSLKYRFPPHSFTTLKGRIG